MPAPSAPDLALRDGNLPLALQLLQDEVRVRPADAKLRIFLFQLLCVMGSWQRAQQQLAVAGEMIQDALSMVQTYREAIRCEEIRAQVFQGKRTPLLLGEPAAWVAMLVEALALDARGEFEQAADLRAHAFDMAPSSSGSIDDRPFAWF